MAHLPEIAVQPELLRWARESTGVKLDTVARRLGVTAAEVGKWEQSPIPLRLTQLEKLSELYKRPLAAFFLPVPPREPALPKDFRTLPDSDSLSPASRLAIRRARRLRTIALELTDILKIRPETKLSKIVSTSDPDAAAAAARKLLGIDITEQLRWRDSRYAFNRWRAAVEDLGVLVFQLSMPIKELRGFSLSEQVFPVTVINTKDSSNGRIFSLLHEIGHLLLNSGGLCDMHEDAALPGGLQTEPFCNAFAGSLLVPRDDLLSHPLVQVVRLERSVSIETLSALANTFRVSQDVILRRLLTVDLISIELYRRKAKELDEAFRNRPKRKSKGGAPPAAKAVQENGVPFASMVLSAYRSEGISSKEVSDYLGVRQKHLPKVEKLLMTKATPHA